MKSNVKPKPTGRTMKASKPISTIYLLRGKGASNPKGMEDHGYGSDRGESFLGDSGFPCE